MILKLAKTKAYSVPHITEEQMRKSFDNICSWISDKDGIVQVICYD